MKEKEKSLSLIISLLFLATATATFYSTVYTYTGSEQRYIVPQGISSLQVELWGGGGYNSNSTGAYVVASINVSPLSTIYIYVGGGAMSAINGGVPGGFNGGGSILVGNSGSGGGASDIRTGTGTLADRVVVAGGGGGSVGSYGGCLVGGGPLGGTQTSGGPTDPPNYIGAISGGLGLGGSVTVNTLYCTSNYCFAGGGGYYGGGAAVSNQITASGGGSSLIPSGGSCIQSTTDAPGGTSSPFYRANVATQQQSGLVALYYILNDCASSPCMNGATCNFIYSTLAGGYYCTCAHGFNGTQCQYQFSSSSLGSSSSIAIVTGIIFLVLLLF